MIVEHQILSLTATKLLVPSETSINKNHIPMGEMQALDKHPNQ